MCSVSKWLYCAFNKEKVCIKKSICGLILVLSIISCKQPTSSEVKEPNYGDNGSGENETTKLNDYTATTGSIEMVGIEAGVLNVKDGDNVRVLDVDDFYMSKYELTFSQVTSIDSSLTSSNNNTLAYSITWLSAVEICNALSRKEDLAPVYYDGDIYSDETTNPNKWTSDAKMDLSKNGYRLPTYEEWEYVARGGSKGVIVSSDDVSISPLGVFNLFGQRSEWCFDANPNDSSKKITCGSRSLSALNATFFKPSFTNASSYCDDTFNDQNLGIRLVRNAR